MKNHRESKRNKPLIIQAFLPVFWGWAVAIFIFLTPPLQPKCAQPVGQVPGWPSGRHSSHTFANSRAPEIGFERYFRLRAQPPSLIFSILWALFRIFPSWRAGPLCNIRHWN